MCLETRKFLCCIPLKVGLLIYGFILLIWCTFNGYKTVGQAEFTIEYIINIYRPTNGDVDITFLFYLITHIIFILFIYFFQPIFAIVLICGVYWNLPKCLKAYFWYNVLFFLPAFIGLTILQIFVFVQNYELRPNRTKNEEMYSKNDYAFAFVIIQLVIEIVITIYVLVAVRSLYIKLKRENSYTIFLLPAEKTLQKNTTEKFTNETR